MSEVIIQVDNLSKQYRLGEVSTGTLSHDLNRWWHRVRGRADPYARVTAPNLRDRRPEGPAPAADYVWALRNVTVEIKRGDVLGIIGRNGAGKSTLLKILSRITAPTEGEVRIDGRIASLLEVGTGFHPDLTGRENIYLNGAILGMTRAEIRRRLDEIVEFSGCGRYLDTPVKRYSSGMVVRLGFAVAAHLEPDILIVDEVLAVGDAEFQKKCIGKMQDVAGHGRTVLFVSHNMDSIRTLTARCVVLDEGRIQTDASTEEAVRRYLAASGAGVLIGPPQPIAQVKYERRVINDQAVTFTALGLAPGASAEIPSGGALRLEIGVQTHGRLDHLSIGYSILHESTAVALVGWSPLFSLPGEGRYRLALNLDKLDLGPGDYTLHLSINRGGLTEAKHTYDILFGTAAFRLAPFRSEGGALPPWKTGWGHAIHTLSSVEARPEPG